MTSRSTFPVLDLNLCEDAVLRDSRAAFASVRETGPAVWLARHRMFAIGRFADVRAALHNDAVFHSGFGVAANPLSNRLGRDTTLFSDGDTHRTRRKVLLRSLAARALSAIEDQLDRQAEQLIERLLARGSFDAAADFATHLPLAVVANLVGLPEDSDRLLRWAAATFDALGPFHRRGRRAAATSASLLLYTARLDPARVTPWSWAATVFDARDRGEITPAEARALVIDFVAPALDTSILASTHLLWTLSRHPQAWREIRQDPTLIPRAVVENVRLGSPIGGFTRHVAAAHQIDGTTLPAGSRAVLMFGAANLDDLLRAMAPRVEEIHTGRPERLLNNTLQGIAHLPARLTPA
jgi:cytochrome P450